MKVVISAESAVDLSPELLKEYNIKTTPFTILLGDDARLDGDVTPSEIIEFVKSTNVLPKTSAVNQFQFEEHFSEILKDADAIVHFSISSEMSSAYSNAVEAAKNFKNVYVIDSRSLSTGIGLLVLYAAKLAQKGASVEEIVSSVLKRIPFVQASFVPSRLDYLYKGGRCSSLVYFAANVFQIKPQIMVKDGKMTSGKKYRGRYESVIVKYVKETLEEFSNPDLEEVFITYTTASSEIVNEIKQVLIERGFKNIRETIAGGTVTSHCGEGTLGVLFINDGLNN
ncbi:MAG: DegV family protein [Clostridia bacterium]|nr:DegV family protein [Clostridia bacterium]